MPTFPSVPLLLFVGGCFLAHEPPPMPDVIETPEVCAHAYRPSPLVELDDLSGAGTCVFSWIEGVVVRALEPAPEADGARIVLVRPEGTGEPYHCVVTAAHVGSDLADRASIVGTGVFGELAGGAIRLLRDPGCGPKEDCVTDLAFWVEVDATEGEVGSVSVRTERTECVIDAGCESGVSELVARSAAASGLSVTLAEGAEAQLSEAPTTGEIWARALRTVYPGCEGATTASWVVWNEGRRE